jgi:glutamate synthase (NADPH/NADH) small chain
MKCLPELEAAPNGCLIVNPETGETSENGIFAAGDILGGRRTVVNTIAEGKRAAQAIHKALGQ